MVQVFEGARDERLGARVVSRLPLVYTEAPPGAPAHVRAASAVRRWGRDLAVVQDDTTWIALVDARSGAVRALPLPPGPQGLTVFDERAGHKHLKPDFEACVVDRGVLFAFGSGSTPARERVAAVRPEVARMVDASAFYQELRADTAFAGSELNLEGAVLLGGELRLVQRGNGAGEAVDALATVDWAALRAWMQGAGPMPRHGDVAQYALGELDGVRLTLTDGAKAPGGFAFVATAESSPDTYRDGEVVGSVIGVVDAHGARWSPLPGVACKAEGLEVDAGGAWVVLDADDPDRPSELLRVELAGPWWA